MVVMWLVVVVVGAAVVVGGGLVVVVVAVVEGAMRRPLGAATAQATPVEVEVIPCVTNSVD